MLQHLRHISILLVSGHGNFIKWQLKTSSRFLGFHSISKYVGRSQYTSQLLRSILTSIRAILMYLKTSPDANAKGYFKNWLNKDRLHPSCFLMDVVALYSRFQMKLQSDDVLVFNFVRERDNFLARLAKAKEKPIIGGWKEFFLSTVKEISHQGEESENDWEFFGMKRSKKQKAKAAPFV